MLLDRPALRVGEILRKSETGWWVRLTCDAFRDFGT